MYIANQQESIETGSPGLSPPLLWSSHFHLLRRVPAGSDALLDAPDGEQDEENHSNN